MNNPYPLAEIGPSEGDAPVGLEHDLIPEFEEMAQFNSLSSLKKSEVYARIEPQLEQIMRTVVHEEWAPGASNGNGFVRATAWNVERGTELDGIVQILKQHPRMAESDVLLLTELDLGMARSGNRFVAREIARCLKLNYAFANCYVSLVKGSGLEFEVEGENSMALHGNALFSRHPLSQVEIITLPNGKDLMRGKEKRLGCQQAVTAVVEHPGGAFRAVSLHLDAHCSQRHRHHQMRLVLDHLEQLEPRLPVLIGGDWNTSTYNSKRATYSILGYARRVLMGVNNVLQNHYPYPDRWFERGLFRELENRGYRYRELNEPGAGTLHYDVEDLAQNTNMGDWIPGWCFWFIRWALQRNGGQCSLKLDWFAGKDLAPLKESAPRVLSEIHSRENPLSDHDPIVLDFRLDAP